MERFKEKLINSEESFKRETFEKRMEQYGFKNMGRMELFLWDLELFLQIQNILGDRSVLTPNENRNKDENQSKNQELKIEFIIQDTIIEYQNVKGTDIFAVSSDIEYQILPINYLFADKLTTLGPNTIGVQDTRMMNR